MTMMPRTLDRCMIEGVVPCKEVVGAAEPHDGVRSEFPGRIEVVDTPAGLRMAVSQLRVESMLGFDTETRPSFRRGEQHRVSLLQLATDSVAWLIRLHLVGDLSSLRAVLSDAKVLKVGLSLPDDLRALGRMGFTGLSGMLDLQPLARGAGMSEQSLRGITAAIFGEYVSKSARLTNWEASELSPKQQMYAATDAWLCYRLARHEPFCSLIAQLGA